MGKNLKRTNTGETSRFSLLTVEGPAVEVVTYVLGAVLVALLVHRFW